jgi:hypothetical protein
MGDVAIDATPAAGEFNQSAAPGGESGAPSAASGLHGHRKSKSPVRIAFGLYFVVRSHRKGGNHDAVASRVEPLQPAALVHVARLESSCLNANAAAMARAAARRETRLADQDRQRARVPIPI